MGGHPQWSDLPGTDWHHPRWDVVADQVIPELVIRQQGKKAAKKFISTTNAFRHPRILFDI